MSDLAEAIATKAIRNAAAELNDLIKTMKAAHILEDEELDNHTWRGAALLNHTISC